MNLEPLQLGSSAQPSGSSGDALLVRLPAGSLQGLLAGQRLQALAQPLNTGETLVTLPGAGQMRLPVGANLPSGASVVVRVRSIMPQLILEFLPPTATPSPEATAQPNPEIGKPSLPDALPRAPSPPTTSPTEAGPATSPSSKAAPLAVGLEQGQTLNVRVLGELPQGKLLVQANGQAFEAVTGQRFPVGTELSVQVSQLRPEIVLRVLEHRDSPQALAASVVRENLGRTPLSETVRAILAETPPSLGNPADSAALTALQTRLRALLPQASTLSPERLAAFLQDGGLHFEAKLSHLRAGDVRGAAQVANDDVKGLLLKALGERPALAPGDSAGTPPLAQHLQSIEFQQAANLLALMRGDPLQLQVPVLLSNGQVSTVAVAISPDEHSDPGPDGKPTGHDLMMHLELTEFGDTRIDAHISPGTLRAIFYVEHATGRAQLQAELPAFRQSLLDSGYATVLLGVRSISELPTEKGSMFAALKQGLPLSGELLDVRI